jgi:phage-related holin
MDDEQGSLVCLGVRRLDRFLLGGTWMYDRDIVFDIKNSTISIYDNVKCVKDAPEMGRKSKNLEAIDEI